MKRLLTLTFIIGIMMPMMAQSYRSVSSPDFATAIQDKKVIILDVRKPMEFLHEHIAGAQCLDVTSAEFDKKAQKLNKKKTIAVYCQRGKRSKTAAEKLATWGYSVVELDGGLNDWTTNANPTIVFDDSASYNFDIYDDTGESCDGSGKFNIQLEYVDVVVGDYHKYFHLYKDAIVSVRENKGLYQLVYMTPDNDKVTLEFADRNVTIRIDAPGSTETRVLRCQITKGS